MLGAKDHVWPTTTRVVEEQYLRGELTTIYDLELYQAGLVGVCLGPQIRHGLAGSVNPYRDWRSVIVWVCGRFRSGCDDGFLVDDRGGFDHLRLFNNDGVNDNLRRRGPTCRQGEGE